MRRILHWLGYGLLLLVLCALAGSAYAWFQLRASLPQVAGTRTLARLASAVTIDRDVRGVPTIRATSRTDAARALGFVHAQDRFFQMDLQRRQAAGELAALVGAAAVPLDTQWRLHRFRRIALKAYQQTDADWRRMLDAYADGVNAGVQALGAPPFEYLVLRTTPEPWQPEDSLLTIVAMFTTLQGRQAGFEQTIGTLRDTLPEPMFRFLAAPGSAWDSPVLGSPLARPAIPGADVFDLRQLQASGATAPAALRARLDERDEAQIIGSNNWAVDAAHSTSGGALVANDMHLNLGVPNIWYRATIETADPVEPAHSSRISGITIPGIPCLVIGSNGFVAWGFTNSNGDWSDLVRLEPATDVASTYLTPDGPRAFEIVQDTIAVKGQASRPFTARWTIWGPVVWKDAQGREYAQHWLAHDPDVLSSDASRPERARSIDELLAAFAGLALPNQNVVMADSSGRIAWTIGGAIPRRVGFDGFTPESWADGSRRWDGYLPAEEFPRIVDPESGRIWTANAPVVDGAVLATIGEGGYADGIRARIIRGRLLAIDSATAADMLDIQLETTALFLDRWRTLVLAALLNTAVDLPARAEFRRLVETTWTGRASVNSVAYRLVRTFRAALVRDVFDAVSAPIRQHEPSFDYGRAPRAEGPVWEMLTQRPLHLLNPIYRSWDEQVLAAVDEAIAELTEDGRALADRTWGETTRVRVTHPLSGAIPYIGHWLNMPNDELPGDVFTPRAQSTRTGASERMVVSPGREQDGILHMPTGQSGHPLSPHYGDQHAAWATGQPLPFLPGPAVTTLTLTP